MGTRWSILSLVVALAFVGGCAGDGDTTGSTTTESAAAPTAAPATEPVDGDDGAAYTVAELGRTPTRSFGPTSALGSGCAPGTDDLPDGVWFGWVDAADTAQVTFDLACLWPGRLEPAAGNDSARLRAVPVSPAARAYRSGGAVIGYDQWMRSDRPQMPMAPGLPQEAAVWVFVNDGVLTEIADHPDSIRWSRSADAWPGLGPACCDAGDVVPPSPADPWPDEGWPVDGFYAVTVDDRSASGYDLAIHRWLRCEDAPNVCPAHWLDDNIDEVVVDPGEPALRRRFPFDSTTRVVIEPIFSEGSLVGDGAALSALLADIDQAVADQAGGQELDWEQLREAGADPAFPFGALDWPDGGSPGPIGYRGPGGAHLTQVPGWWMALEIRGGQPILYIHAGMVAG